MIAIRLVAMRLAGNRTDDLAHAQGGGDSSDHPSAAPPTPATRSHAAGPQAIQDVFARRLALRRRCSTVGRNGSAVK